MQATSKFIILWHDDDDNDDGGDADADDGDDDIESLCFQKPIAQVTAFCGRQSERLHLQSSLRLNSTWENLVTCVIQ